MNNLWIMGEEYMDYINVKIPEYYAREIDSLIEQGIFSSRAEVVRVALRQLLKQIKKDDIVGA